MSEKNKDGPAFRSVIPLVTENSKRVPLEPTREMIDVNTGGILGRPVSLSHRTHPNLSTHVTISTPCRTHNHLENRSAVLPEVAFHPVTSRVWLERPRLRALTDVSQRNAAARLRVVRAARPPGAIRQCVRRAHHPVLDSRSPGAS